MTGTMLGESMRRRRGSRRSEPKPPRQGGARTSWAWWLLAFVLVLPAGFGAGYLVAVHVLFPAPPMVGGGIAVPDLVGLTPERAEGELAAVGLELGEALELAHPERPAGTIIAQSPLAGQLLATAGAVDVALSAGAPRVAVPDVAGMSADRAAELLERLGFQVARRDEPAPEEPGRVLRIDPRAGTELALPANVTVIVSSGMPIVEDTLIQDTGSGVDPGDGVRPGQP